MRVRNDFPDDGEEGSVGKNASVSVQEKPGRDHIPFSCGRDDLPCAKPASLRETQGRDREPEIWKP